MPEKKKIHFYPIDVAVRSHEGRSVIYLFGRTSENKQVCVVDKTFHPYFYVKLKEDQSEENVISSLKNFSLKQDYKEYKIENITKEKKNFFLKELNVLKIFVNDASGVPKICEKLKEKDIIERFFENDIPFFKRYLIDNQITTLSLCECEGTFEAYENRIPTFEMESIKQISDDTYSDFKILAFDIETYNEGVKLPDVEKDPILMVSLYSKNYKKVICWKPFKTDLDYVEFVDSEEKLIRRFKECVDSVRPDILTGYYSDGFDMPYIIKRARKYKLSIDIGLDYSDVQLSRQNDGAAKITGISHIDVLMFIRRNFANQLKTDSYTLNKVSEELLGEKKLDVDLTKISEAWDEADSEQLTEFCRYNLKDSRLTYDLCMKVLPNIIELTRIVGLPIVEVNRVGFSQLVENYLMRNAYLRNELVPPKPSFAETEFRREHSAKGAFVFQPKPGLYENVVVFDFKSLYPSIIASHNISPETMNCDCCEGKEEVPFEEKKIWFCKNRKGFISSLIEDIMIRRQRVKEILKKTDDEQEKVILDAKQYSLKVLLNSIYGYIGFSATRWYSMESMQSITAYGRNYIHQVIEEAEAYGFEVIYGDTDSIFIWLKDKEVKDSKDFVENLNQKLPGLMELEFEGFYKRGVFVSAKGSDLGAKKKYALISEDDEISVKGFETVRRNWSFIAKEIQRRVLNIILSDNDVEKAKSYVVSMVNKLKDRDIELDKLAIITQLTKSIEEYDSIGPHVEVAKRLRSRGLPVGPGSLISYIITSGSGRLRDKAKSVEEVKSLGGDYDSDYYIQNQIIPSVNSIFNVLGVNIEEEISGKKQSKLGSFM